MTPHPDPLPASGARRLLPLLQHTAPDLIELDRLEQRLEVALAESFVALALDYLEEDRTDHSRREDLQEHLVLCRRAVEKDPIFSQPRRVLAVIPQPGRKQI